MVKIATIAIIAITTASCASSSYYGADFSSRAAGFSAGCASVNSDLTRRAQVANEEVFLTGDESEFRRGWLNGRNTCIATRILPPG